MIRYVGNPKPIIVPAQDDRGPINELLYRVVGGGGGGAAPIPRLNILTPAITGSGGGAAEITEGKLSVTPGEKFFVAVGSGGAGGVYGGDGPEDGGASTLARAGGPWTYGAAGGQGGGGGGGSQIPVWPNFWSSPPTPQGPGVQSIFPWAGNPVVFCRSGGGGPVTALGHLTPPDGSFPPGSGGAGGGNTGGRANNIPNSEPTVHYAPQNGFRGADGAVYMNFAPSISNQNTIFPHRGPPSIRPGAAIRPGGVSPHSPLSSLSEAIPYGDDLIVTPGVYSEAILATSGAMKIKSEGGPTQTVIISSGNHLGNVELDGFSIINANPSLKGPDRVGVKASGNVILSNCIITDFGYGLEALQGRVAKCYNCVFLRNQIAAVLSVADQSRAELRHCITLNSGADPFSGNVHAQNSIHDGSVPAPVNEGGNVLAPTWQDAGFYSASDLKLRPDSPARGIAIATDDHDDPDHVIARDIAGQPRNPDRLDSGVHAMDVHDAGVELLMNHWGGALVASTEQGTIEQVNIAMAVTDIFWQQINELPQDPEDKEEASLGMSLDEIDWELVE